MQLLTKAIETQLAKAPLNSTDGSDIKKVIVKFFTPDAQWTWYAVEGTKQPNGDWEFFGLVDGLEKEWGYFTLSELKAIRGRFNLPVERDRFFDNKFISLEDNTFVMEAR